MIRTVSLLAALALSTSACALSRHAEATASPPAASTPTSWDEVLAGPAVIALESTVSARWSVPLSGLVNLEHPAAVAAGLADGDTPIVLPVHALRHPDAGVFVVDTGIDSGLADGGRGGTRGLLRAFIGGMEPVEPLAAILERQGAPLAGVLITHAHLDHVLGLPDVPADAPIYMGPGELQARDGTHALMRRTYNALLRGHDPVQTWGFDDAPTIEGIPALDVAGDGSLWALSTPGHTAGSASYLALTTDGPALFVGDTCHTIWGWQNGVEPGTYTADQPLNAENLAKLKALADAHPEIQVFVGHELSGEGTGVGAVVRD